MEGLFAALKAFFDKRQQEVILLLGVAEESADVAIRAQLRTGEANGIVLVRTNDVHGGVLSVLERLFSLADQRAGFTVLNYTPRWLGTKWFKSGCLTLLLDGLDEIPAACRRACIESIKEYEKSNLRAGLVVGCRLVLLWRAFQNGGYAAFF